MRAATANDSAFFPPLKRRCNDFPKENAQTCAFSFGIKHLHWAVKVVFKGFTSFSSAVFRFFCCCFGNAIDISPLPLLPLDSMRTLVDSEIFNLNVEATFGPFPYTHPLMEQIDKMFGRYLSPPANSTGKDYTVIPITDTLLAIHKTFKIHTPPCEVVILFSESATEIHRLSLTISAIPLAVAA